MTELQLKNRVGLLLIVSHFAIVILLVTLYFPGGFKFDEMTTAVALISPVFAVYTTAIVRFFIANQQKSTSEGPQLAPTFVALSFAVPLIFIVAVTAIILLWAYKIGFDNFEQFKQLFALLEAVFAVYIGFFITSLFGELPQRQPLDPTPQ